MAPERLLGFADIAREAGMTRQAVQDFYLRGKMPDPDYVGPRDAPLWRRRTLTGFFKAYRR